MTSGAILGFKTTPTQTSMPTSSVAVESLKVEKVKLGTKRHVQKALVLFVQFSGALDTTAAQNLAAYSVFSGKIKHVHRVSQVSYNKLVPLTQAIYNASGDSVILVPGESPRCPTSSNCRSTWRS